MCECTLIIVESVDPQMRFECKNLNPKPKTGLRLEPEPKPTSKPGSWKCSIVHGVARACWRRIALVVQFLGHLRCLLPKSLTPDSRSVASIFSSSYPNIKCLVSLQSSHTNKQIYLSKVESYLILKCCLV
jgi:hypothetical protein